MSYFCVFCPSLEGLTWVAGLSVEMSAAKQLSNILHYFDLFCVSSEGLTWAVGLSVEVALWQRCLLAPHLHLGTVQTASLTSLLEPKWGKGFYTAING